MGMITIVSRKKFHFYNPDPALDILKINLDNASDKNRKQYRDAIFVTNGRMEMQAAPDWINAKLGPDSTKNGVDLNQRNLLTWRHAVDDGDLYQVEVKDSPKEVSDLAASATAQQAAENHAEKQAKEAQKDRENEAREASTKMFAMTKAQIVEFAKTEYDLELDESSVKKDLIDSVIACIMTVNKGSDEGEHVPQGTVRT